MSLSFGLQRPVTRELAAMPLTKQLLYGLAAGMAMSALEFVVHGMLLSGVYQDLARAGVMAQVEKPGAWLHYPLEMFLGVPLVALYSIAWGHFASRANAVIAMTLLEGLLMVLITSPLYSFYNLGAVVPIAITLEKTGECLLANAIASVGARRGV